MSVHPIPPIQIAAVIASTSTSVSAKVGIKSNHPVPTPGKGEILVKLEFSGIERSSELLLTFVVDFLVGPEVDEKQWMGTRVGIRSVFFIQIDGSTALVASVKFVKSTIPYARIRRTLVQGIQIAAKKGLRVIAIDSGDKKKELCLSLGATDFLDYNEVDIVQAVKTKTIFGVHAVICTANSERAYEQGVQMLRPFGTLVCVGIPNKPFKLPATPFDMIVKGLTVVGNSAGTADEMDEMLAMAVSGDVKAQIDIFDLDDINDVLDRLERSDIDGRVVLRIPQ
ncbi:Alcohol dehydrogenase, putative [Penicillium digitatum PHI26]|uniref:Alcohol dehydrogenase, putative n=2 Tax=Penicillium digitatum TaxID=36651 RepID=K9G0U6_PEND2|nr:Alcohol dehydrogenase, putative [Penicillium digitatum Pd1]EKV09686.1 Alcohol dehydrogenase, putative [Penicillium digitatum Pd1]EKV14994.1 Alcohol dehydrogenase, putative [Penicillium digitatum PHI26]